MIEPNPHLPLRLDKVNYTIDNKALIEDFSVEIQSPGISIILGHNGAGKSLLLKLLHGVIEPFSGSIHWQQQTPNSQQYWRTLVLQKPSFFDRSVRFHLEFVLSISQTEKAQQQERIEQALDVCGLSELQQRKVSSLSGGEIQRLSLARAWVLRPKVLLLDEPTVALDPPAAYQFEALVKQFRDSGSKIIMTTHDIPQAQRLADEVIFIYQGKLAEQADASSFFKAPTSSIAQHYLKGQLVVEG